MASVGIRTWSEVWLFPCADKIRPDHPVAWCETIFESEDDALRACEHCRLRQGGCVNNLPPGVPAVVFDRRSRL